MSGADNTTDIRAATQAARSVQLALPLEHSPDSRPQALSASRRIFANRDLKLSRIDWVGFDMDYTLVLYIQRQMDQLSIEATTSKLVARGYPDWLLKLTYPLHFPIRGLLIDKQLGHVLKLNRFKVVRRGFHGLRELTRNDLRALYYERKLRHKSSRFHWIDTLYGLSEVCMFATIVDAFEQRGVAPRFGRLFGDIRECIDESHRDGSILSRVMAHPERYVMRDESLALMLHRLRSAGKRLFLLTNSHWTYTETLMTHLLDGSLGDYPSFKHYFDAVIVAAKKPGFFTEKNPLKERRSGQLLPLEGPLQRGKVYQGGNIGELQDLLGVSGDRVLYLGDHIYGDMLRSKKDSAWRTAMVIQELEAEIHAHDASREDSHHLAALQNRRSELDEALRHHQQLLSYEQRQTKDGDSAETLRLKRLVGAIRRQLGVTHREASKLRRAIDQRFHPYWGSLLKEGSELSLFGHQVSEYAGLYTGCVTNLNGYSPQQYFRSPHNLMHHEL
jgi:5'-nucleotidase